MTGSLIGIIIAVAVISLLVWFFLKRWNSSWEGVLQDKDVKTSTSVDVDEDGNESRSNTTNYILIFKTKEGEIKKISTSKKKFDLATVGDKYIKEAKSWNPKKI
jgi:hypothetical protein